jgi:hypothetical protein
MRTPAEIVAGVIVSLSSVPTKSAMISIPER